MSVRPIGRRLAVLFLLASVVLAAAGCRRIDALFHTQRCVLSERPIHARLAVQVAIEGGPDGEACCLRCAITYAQQNHQRVRILWVTDYPTGHRLDPRRAIYVTGSDVNRCMGPPEQATAGRRETSMIVWDRCSPSSIAFATEDEAARFRKEHGGQVETFEEIAASAAQGRIQSN